MTIAIDFDGTCVTHDYPEVGEEIGAVPVLKRLVADGHKLILFTMRSDTEERKHLSEAISWFVKNEINLFGIQFNPTQKQWTTSNKCYAQLYIDDAAFGAPLTERKDHSRPFINWKIIEEHFYPTTPSMNTQSQNNSSN